MATAQEFGDDALALIGELASGQTPSAEDRAIVLRTLNRLVDSWSASGVAIPSLTLDNSVTLNGAESYTLSTRPLGVKAASVRAANGATKPAAILDAPGWGSVEDKTRTGIYAEALFFDAGYPTAKVYVSPKPSAGTLELWVYRALEAGLVAGDELAFPPGYERALLNALAIDICSIYGREVPASVAAVGSEAFGYIAARNAEVLGIPAPGASEAAQ